MHEISRKEFLAFGRTKSGPYDYSNTNACAMSQFAQEALGIREASASSNGISNSAGATVAIYDSNSEIPESLLIDCGTWEELTRELQSLEGAPL